MKVIMQRLLAIFRAIESGMLVGSLFAIILLTTLQIILRNIDLVGLEAFSLTWIDPLNRHLVLWIALLGAMVAGRKNEHIAFDLVQHYLPKSVKPYFLGAGGVLSSFVCAYLAFIFAQEWLNDYHFGFDAFSGIPQWFFEIIIPVAFAVIGFRLFIHAMIMFTSSGKSSEEANK